MQPLSGLLVLDFTTLLPGPLATLMLAEAGAEVIKIERPGGEDMRRFGSDQLGAAAFAMLNRGKRSLFLDLKTSAGRAELQPLLERADVLVEQFRPGVMQRLGLGYAEVTTLNPQIIYCSISGYGQDGPRAQEAGHDLNYIAQTGLLALQPGPPSTPVVPPALTADIGGGSFPAVMNILLGLRQRDRSGRGCRLDIAMADAMFTFGWLAWAQGASGGAYPRAGETILTGASPRYQLYPTRDGKLVACGALEDHFWSRFLAAIGLADDNADDPAAMKEIVRHRIADKTADEWRPVLAQADCCASIVATLEEALADRHFVERGLFDDKVKLRSGTSLPALPVPIAKQFRDQVKSKDSP